MEFKSIDQLTIKDCLGLLAIDERQLKARVAKEKNVNTLLDDSFYVFGELSGQKALIKNRFKELVYNDRIAFLKCSTISDYNAYVSSNEFGLWRSESSSKINQINALQEEKKMYSDCKGSVNGLKKYIRLYPNGHYVEEARKLLKEKEQSHRIKRIVCSLIVLAVLFLICFFNYEPSSYIRTNDNVRFTSRGGEKICEVSTDALEENVSVYCSCNWLTTEVKNGKLIIKTIPNHGDSHTSSITLNAFTTLFGFNLWSEKCVVHVNQESGLASYLSVSRHDCSFDKYGNEEYKIKIYTDGLNLKVKNEYGWIKLEKDSVDDGKVITTNLVVKSSVNETDTRQANIVITSDNFSETITVKQSSGLATYFNVSTDNLVMKEEGTSENSHYPIRVSTDGTTWSITEAPYWLTAEAKVSSGLISITLPPNTGKIKTGTITVVSNNGDSYDISVKQMGDPSDFSASPSSLRFGTSSDYEYVSIDNNSSKSIYASSDKSWLSTSVSNKNKIKINCSKNNSSPRSGTVTVTCGHEELTITVKQDGWTDCTRCNGNGEVNCTNYQAQPRYYPAYGTTWHQVYGEIGGYWSYGVWMPQYGWVNCSTCGGDGKIRCPKCDGKGKIPKSY